MKRAIIVDDTIQIRKLLRLMLAEIADDIQVVGEAENSEIAMQLINEHQPDLVFLDIEMPGKNGIQLAEELVKQNNEIYIIFITAFNNYAVKAFRLAALDYLLKPVKEKELKEALDKFRLHIDDKKSIERLKSLVDNFTVQMDNTLAIPLNHGFEQIPIEAIVCFEADGSYTIIHLKDGKSRTISKNLKYFETKLTDFSCFVKVSRSFIINYNQLHFFDKSNRGIIHMSNGRSINLSRSCRADFLHFIENHQ